MKYFIIKYLDIPSVVQDISPENKTQSNVNRIKEIPNFERRLCAKLSDAQIDARNKYKVKVNNDLLKDSK